MFFYILILNIKKYKPYTRTKKKKFRHVSGILRTTKTDKTKRNAIKIK